MDAALNHHANAARNLIHILPRVRLLGSLSSLEDLLHCMSKSLGSVMILQEAASTALMV